MEKILSTFNFKKNPGGFLLGMSLILLFETGNFFFDDAFYPNEIPAGYFVKVKNEQVQKVNTYDVLILGDCYISGALEPNILQAQTGLSSYNFANQMAQTVLSTYAMFKNYLNRSSKKPDYLVLSFIPETSVMERRQVEQQNIPYFYDVSQGNLNVFIGEFGLGTGLKLIIPSMKHQDFYTKRDFKDHFMNLEKGKNRRNEISGTMAELNGWYPWQSDNLYNGEIKESQYIKEHPHGYRASSFFRKYLEAILEKAYQNNIQVIYILPSRPPDLYALDNKYGVTQQYANLIKEAADRYPGMIVLDPQDLINKDMYSDSMHLNRKGAQILSEYLSKYLTARKREHPITAGDNPQRINKPA